MARLLNWKSYGGCMSIMLVALLIRFFRLDFQSLWYDEAFSASITRYDLWSIAERTAQDTMPPLYYWLVQYATTVWPNDFGARFVSAVAGFLSVALVYALGNQLFGKKVASLAGLITALSPFQVYYSQEARMYTLLGALQLAAALCFVLALSGRKRVYWAGFGVFTALALYTHNMAVLSLAALVTYYGVWLFVKHPNRRPNVAKAMKGSVAGGYFFFDQFKGFVSSMGFITVLFLPWLTILPSQIAMVSASFWDTGFSVWKVLATPYLLILNVSLGGWLQFFGLFVVLLLTVFVLRAAVKSFSNQIDIEQLSFLLALTFLPIIILSLLSIFKPLYLERVLIGASYSLYLLIAWWLIESAPRLLAVISGSLVIAMMVIGLHSWYFVAESWKPPMREAAAYLRQNAVQGDVVLHTSDGSYRPFDWYEPEMRNQLAWGDPDLQPGKPRFQSSVLSLGVEPVEITDVARRQSRVWLVVALDHSTDWQLQQKQWFDKNSRLVKEGDFKGIRVFLYETARAIEVSG